MAHTLRLKQTYRPARSGAMATIAAARVLAEEQALALRAAESGVAAPERGRIARDVVPAAEPHQEKNAATNDERSPAARTRRCAAGASNSSAAKRLSVGESTGVAFGMAPAPRAHLYLAASTATGVSVVYGYAGMPWAKRCSAASSTSTSPASETTMGFSMPCSHLVDDLDHLGCEHHRWRDDRVPVAEYQRMDAWVFEPELDRVLVRLRRLAAGDIDRVASGTEGRDELRNAASRSAGIAISDRPLSTCASESSTPEPPAPVMMSTFSPLGVGGNRASESSRSRKLRARITPDCFSTSS